MGSLWGRAFRVSTFGESHGGGLGAVIDGCPPGVRLDVERIQRALDRRRPGTGKLVSARRETDEVEILSGVFEGRTLGTSLAMLFRNRDADPRAYADFSDRYRPSHADYTYGKKYGLRAWAGGGRASARETVARVAAGAVALQVLESFIPVEVVAWVDAVGAICAGLDPEEITAAAVEASAVRCPSAPHSDAMEAEIRAAKSEGDTVGGVIRAVVRGLPVGLGAPVFDKLDAELAKAMLSIPAAKGFEVGSGFAGTRLRGSVHNDIFIPTTDGVRTRTNHSGGIQGGISNGMPITLSVAFKPVATIFQDQETVNNAGEAVMIRPRGRHDPCVVARAVPIVESMVALVLLDHWILHRGQVGSELVVR